MPSGVLTGTMASTNVIYSNILEVSRMDNIGIELNWTGTPTGTIQVLTSISGLNWPAITFDPAIGQPAGSAAYEGIGITQYDFKYLMLLYTNSSGSGVLTAYAQFRDLN